MLLYPAILLADGRLGITDVVDEKKLLSVLEDGVAAIADGQWSTFFGLLLGHQQEVNMAAESKKVLWPGTFRQTKNPLTATVNCDVKLSRCHGWLSMLCP